jgi:hypothetical protein
MGHDLFSSNLMNEPSGIYWYVEYAPTFIIRQPLVLW